MFNFKGVFKHILKLVKAAMIILVIIELTMFGWRPVFSKPIELTGPMQETVFNLRRTVKTLSEEIGARNFLNYSNLNKSAELIEYSLNEYGYDVVRQNYTVDRKIYSNIIARSRRWDKTKELMIVGAHYDSCFTPGADDNGSGVAGMLELARLLKDDPAAEQIQFVAFTNEEPPYFFTPWMGSRVYADWLSRQGFKVKAVVVLEMLGFYSNRLFSQRYLPLIGLFYPNKGNFIAVVGNFPSGDLVSRLVKGFKQSSSFPIEAIVAPSFIPGIYFSDHASFWKNGYPAVMVTDTAYLRNRNYHKMTDRIETINFEKMAGVVYGLKDALVRLARE